MICWGNYLSIVCLNSIHYGLLFDTMGHYGNPDSPWGLFKLSTVRIMSVDVIYINSLSIFYSKERGCLDFECTSGQIVYLQQCMLFLIREFRWIRKSSVKLGRRSVRWGRFTAGSSKTFNPSSLERRWAHQLCELILSCLQ